MYHDIIILFSLCNFLKTIIESALFQDISTRTTYSNKENNMI